MNIIRKNKQKSYTNRNNREKFKEDIKLMSEVEKRNNYDYMIEIQNKLLMVERILKEFLYLP